MGVRLGYIIVKMTLCTLLHNFDFEAIDPKLIFAPGCFLLADKNDVRMRMWKRDDKSEIVESQGQPQFLSMLN